MNKDLQTKLDEFIKAFLDQDIVKQYFALEKKISNDESLLKLQEDLKIAQKNLALSINDNLKHKENLKIYLSLKNELENNPMVVNYNLLKEEIYNRLKNLQEKLN